MMNTDAKSALAVVTRRNFLLGSSAFGMGLGPASASSNSTSDNTKTFVLVHGAWHGGWCWTPVANELRSRGHRVFQPTLTGLGERLHLASESIDLDTHVTDITNVIHYENLTDIVLVGHSYAGFVITGVANRIRERIRKLVFLDAFLPDPGDSFESVTGLDLKLYAREGGVAPLLSAMELGIRDHALASFVEYRLCPHPVGSMKQAIEFDPGKLEMLDALYIRTSFLFEQEERKALRRGYHAVAEASLGHDAMLTWPSRVADLIAPSA